jgi:hypothetical protein
VLQLHPKASGSGLWTFFSSLDDEASSRLRLGAYLAARHPICSSIAVAIRRFQSRWYNSLRICAIDQTTSEITEVEDIDM